MSEHHTMSAALGVTLGIPLESMGSDHARQHLAEALQALTQIAENHRGTVLNASTDALSIAFDDARDGKAAAHAMREQLRQLPGKLTLTAGLAPTLGAAMGQMFVAGAGDIVTSPELRDALSAPRADTTSDGSKLVVTYGTQTWSVDPQARDLKIGRTSECALQITDPLVSRIHVTLLRQGNRFVLFDTSTNGTYVQEAGKPEVKVLQQSHALGNEGSFTLGRPLEAAKSGPIRYRIDKA